jgi:hypothetical protein
MCKPEKIVTAEEKEKKNNEKNAVMNTANAINFRIAI